MTRYPWTDVDQLEDAIASAAASAEIARAIPGLETFSMSARRDAALAELLASRLEVFNVKTFGAKGDGVTDDTSAIAAAALAASTTGLESTVYFPPGTYLVSATLTVYDKVSWHCASGAILQASGSPFGPMVKTEIVSGFGNRHGRVTGLRLDGNRIATSGLLVQEGCVQRSFEAIDIRNCTSQGLIVSAAQNNTFVSCHAELNGGNGTYDCNLLLDLGAGNNVFVGCEFSSESASAPASAWDAYVILIRQSATSPSGAFSVPSGNAFFGCRAERVSTATLAAIYQAAGRYNTFHRCDIQTTGTRDAVRVDSADGTSLGLRFHDCFFSGQTANSTCFRATGTDAPALILEGMNFWENFSVGLAVADATNVELLGTMEGSVTTFVSPTGSDTAPGLVVHRTLRIDGSPSNSTGVVPGIGNSSGWLYDSTNHRIHVYSGAWRSAGLVLQTIATPTYGASVAINAAGASYNRITVTDANALTISNPTNSVVGQNLIIDIYNTSGGSMGTVTWDTNYKLSGAFTNPATGQHRQITFTYDGSRWREINRTGSDQAN